MIEKNFDRAISKGKIEVAFKDQVMGILTYRLRHTVNPKRVPTARVDGIRHVYFRYLSDCNAKLEIDGEKIGSDSVQIHELYI